MLSTEPGMYQVEPDLGLRLVQYGSTEAAGKVIHSRKELAQLR